MKFWLSNHNTEFTWAPRLKVNRLKRCVSLRWFGVVFSLKRVPR